jgi:hypothetical protein
MTAVTAESAGNTTLPVVITGDSLIYDNATQEIFGRGHIILKHADTVIFSDLIYVNPDTGDVSAEGNVLVTQTGSKIYTDKFYYNTKTQNAYTQNADILSPPWFVKGKKLVKEGDKTELQTPVFTTCDDEKPHYRMEAALITLYGRERIEAWHVVLYLGTIPVFYFPYFTQNLEGNKDPFNFKFGHNDTDGWFAGISYYFYLKFLQESNINGTVGFDFYEKRGPAYNTDLQYTLNPRSTGDMSGSYMNDRESGLKRWWVLFDHNQTLSDTMRAGLRMKSASDSDLAKDLFTSNVDMFQNEYYGSFSGTFFGTQSIAVDTSDIEQLNTITSKYQTSSRTLPNVTYSMTSMQLLPHVYYSHSASFNRTYITGGSPDYNYRATLAPALTLNTPKLYIATLSENAAFNSIWTKNSERESGGGRFLNTMNSNETLQLDVAPGGLMTASLTHTYAKQLNKFESMPHSGTTANQLGTNLSGSWGVINYGANLTYDMLRGRDTLYEGKDLDRLSLINTTAGISRDAYYLSNVNSISLMSRQVRSTSLDFSITDTGPKKLWMVTVSTSFINNLIDAVGHPVVGPRIDDSITYTTSFSFGFTPDLHASVYRQYDLVQKTLIEQTYALTWFIHCWQVDFSWSKRQDNVEQLFFTVSLAAIPEFRFSKPSTAMPDYLNTMGSFMQ